MRGQLNPAQQQIISLIEVFDRVDSSFRQAASDEQALMWCPSKGREEQAFRDLVAPYNREALKNWYASISAINPQADRFRIVLERATGDSLSVGR